ncbi:MAG TPA: hypothetical protein VGM88_07795 [Kofleriaceae bacterium]|jgi:hypothetical protein
MTAAAQLAALGDSAALAIRASVAARVDRALLRDLRLSLPALDATAESDVWFSPLVARRTADEIAFSTGALDELRARVDASWLPAVRASIRRLHAAPPPLLALEEELVYLALSAGAPAALDALLAGAWRTLRDDPSRAPAVAAWALEAFPRLPPAVRTRGAAVSLVWEASARISASIELSGPAPLDAVLPIGTSRVAVGVTRTGDTLSLGRGAVSLVLPDTSPRILLVTVDGVTRAATVPSQLHVPAGASLELATLAGDRWRVVDTAAPQPKPPELTAEDSGVWIFVDGPLKLDRDLERRAMELGRDIALAGASLITLGTPGVATACARGMWSVLAQQGYSYGVYRMSHVGDATDIERGRSISATDGRRFATEAADLVCVLGESPELTIPTHAASSAQIATAARQLDDPRLTADALLELHDGDAHSPIEMLADPRPSARLVAMRTLVVSGTNEDQLGRAHELALLAERRTIRRQEETRTAELAIDLCSRTVDLFEPAQREVIATLCQILRLDARNIPGSAIEARIARLGDRGWMRRAWLVADRAIAYESVRATQTAGDERTRELSGIVSEIQSVASGIGTREIQLWFESGHPGARVAAIALVASAPSPELFELLLAALRTAISSFEQYWSLRAAQSMMSPLSSEQRARLIDCLAEIRDANPHDLVNDDSRARMLAALLYQRA